MEEQLQGSQRSMQILEKLLSNKEGHGVEVHGTEGDRLVQSAFMRSLSACSTPSVDDGSEFEQVTFLLTLSLCYVNRPKCSP